MLVAKKRITKEKEFEKIFGKHEVLRAGSLSLRICPNGLDFSRFGFVVSKKVSKKAVVRNKIRRRLSAIVADKMDEIKPGYDVILSAMIGAEGKGYGDLENDLLVLIKKAKLLKK